MANTPKPIDKFVPLNAVTVGTDPNLLLTMWDMLRFIEGRALQSREANEIVSVLDYYLRNLGNAIFAEGDRITGGAIHVANNLATMTAGLFFIGGKVRPVPPGTVTINGVGHREGIGIKINTVTITENDLAIITDTTTQPVSTAHIGDFLRDPAVSTPNAGMPGAWRTRIDCTWVRVYDNDTILEPTVVATYKLVDGLPVIDDTPPEFSQLLPELERRTFEESGHYKVFGFHGSFAPLAGDKTQLLLSVDSGLAYVKGHRLPFGRTTLNYPLQMTTAVLPKPDIFTFNATKGSSIGLLGNNYVYELGARPVAEITTVDYVTQTPVMTVTSGGNPTNNLASSISVFNTPPPAGSRFSGQDGSAFSRIYTGTTGHEGLNLAQDPGFSVRYNYGTDYQRDPGDTITWLGAYSANPPAIYYAQWWYHTDNGNPAAAAIKAKYQRTVVTGEAVTHAHGSDTLAHGDIIRASRVYLGAPNAPTTVFVEGQDYTVFFGRYVSGFTVSQIRWLTHGNSPTIATTFYVDYEYWDHVIVGDYTAVDSYYEPDGITPNRIDVGVNEKSTTAIDTSISGPSDQTNYTGYVTGFVDLDIQASIDFRPEFSDLSARLTPINGTPVTVTYSYYLPRMDTVGVDRNGDITVYQGTASNSPAFPAIPADDLAINLITTTDQFLAPKIQDALTTRHTMGDIQNLHHRIEVLEQNVLATDLEEEAEHASSAQVLPTSIFTDSFRDSSKADLSYSETDPSDQTNVISCTVSFSGLSESIQMGYVHTSPLPTSVDLISLLDLLKSHDIQTTTQALSLALQDAALITQSYGSTAYPINTASAYDPIQHVVLDHYVDFWADLSQAPLATVPASVSDSPTIPPPAPPSQTTPSKRLLSNQQQHWYTEFLIGVDQISADGRSGSAVSYNQVIQDGTLGATVGGVPVGQSDTLSPGRVPVLANIQKRRTTETTQGHVVSRDIRVAMPRRTVNVVGLLFPPNATVSAKVDGRPVHLIAVAPSVAGVDATHSGIAYHTVVADASGGFTAQLTIPETVYAGSSSFEFYTTVQVGPSPVDQKLIVSKVAYMTRPNLKDLSVLTVANDPVGQYAPLAQTFTPLRTTALTSLDLFFATKHATRGVVVEIRTTDNGLPTATRIGMAHIDAASINTSSDGAVATHVTFHDPVLVQGGALYAVVLQADSAAHSVWVSQVGQHDRLTGAFISKQPEAGVLLESVNGVNWTALTDLDLKYTLNSGVAEALSGTAVFHPVHMDLSYTFTLAAAQSLVSGTTVKWFARVDGGDVTATSPAVFPIEPNVPVSVSQGFGSVALKAVLTTAASDRIPIINSQSLGLVAVANTGAMYAPPFEAGGIYQVGDTVVPSTKNGHGYRVIEIVPVPGGNQFAGVSGNEPVWPTNGSTVISSSGSSSVTFIDTGTVPLVSDYVSMNVDLGDTTSPYSTVQIFTDEYTPTTETQVTAYFSWDGGTYWQQMPEPKNANGTNTIYAATPIGNGMHEVVRKIAMGVGPDILAPTQVVGSWLAGSGGIAVVQPAVPFPPVGTLHIGGVIGVDLNAEEVAYTQVQVGTPTTLFFPRPVVLAHPHAPGDPAYLIPSTFNQYRIRIRLSTTNKALTPQVARLRAIVY